MGPTCRGGFRTVLAVSSAGGGGGQSGGSSWVQVIIKETDGQDELSRPRTTTRDADTPCYL